MEHQTTKPEPILKLLQIIPMNCLNTGENFVGENFNRGKLFVSRNNISSLFPNESFPQLYLTVTIFWLFYCF